jgi:hypothetical protein
VIEQFGQGIAGWRMPVAEFRGNSAWLQIARLAWNLGKWIAQIALPSEVVRWEWKRFRRHFVYIAAKVLKSGRRLVVRLAGSHRFLPDILTAHVRLQTSRYDFGRRKISLLEQALKGDMHPKSGSISVPHALTLN